MRQNPWQVWHRCGTCGTIFSDLDELRQHAREHTRVGHPGLTVHTEDTANSSDIPADQRRFDSNRKKQVAVPR